MLEELISKYLNKEDSKDDKPEVIKLSAIVIDLGNGGRLHYLYDPNKK